MVVRCNYCLQMVQWKFVIVMCNDDWNTGLRRCPEKMSSLGGPTLKKNTTSRTNRLNLFHRCQKSLHRTPWKLADSSRVWTASRNVQTLPLANEYQNRKWHQVWPAYGQRIFEELSKKLPVCNMRGHRRNCVQCDQKYIRSSECEGETRLWFERFQGHWFRLWCIHDFIFK